MSGGSPASLPNKSRLVEAICILLSTKHTSGRKDSSKLLKFHEFDSNYFCNIYSLSVCIAVETDTVRV